MTKSSIWPNGQTVSIDQASSLDSSIGKKRRAERSIIARMTRGGRGIVLDRPLRGRATGADDGLGGAEALQKRGGLKTENTAFLGPVIARAERDARLG